MNFTNIWTFFRKFNQFFFKFVSERVKLEARGKCKFNRVD